MGRFRWEGTHRRRKLPDCSRISRRMMLHSRRDRRIRSTAARPQADWPADDLGRHGAEAPLFHVATASGNVARNDMRLNDRVALITGGTSGIGEATALLFAKEGAEVAITGRDRDRGKAVLKQIKQFGDAGIFLRADVSSPGDCRRAVEETLNAFGRIDILFNNAGVYYPQTA